MTEVRCMCGHADHELHTYFTKSSTSRTTEQTSNREAVGGDEVVHVGDSLATGERMDDYGHPAVAFERIAGLWSEYLNKNLTAYDVGAMMILLKVSRLRTNPLKADTLDDITGYADCLRMVTERRGG